MSREVALDALKPGESLLSWRDLREAAILSGMRLLVGFVGVVLSCLGCSGTATDVGHPGGGANSVGASAGQGGATAQGGNSQGGVTTTTNNVFVDQLVQTGVTKIDLLLMIDNSVSMADKQDVLKAAVPVLIGRLVSPRCIDQTGAPTGMSAQPDGTCADAVSAPEFAPVSDIHIGIVSSSLGSHGGVVCAAPAPGDDPGNSHLDDQGHLIGTERTGLITWNNSGFLAWDPAGRANTPPGESSAANLSANFAAMIEATGEHGCGFEASLESWYRFLIDPEPPATVSKVGNATVRQGIDSALLAQRAAFLRPDSLVAIVMLTDENDCSIRDDGIGWFVGSSSHMPKATAVCAGNPNDACCRSCAQNETSPPAGCTPLSADPACMGAPAGSYNTWDNLHDALNLRCYDQKQRFGFDLLYETQRYVTGLTSPVLTLQSDPTKTVTNPLYDTHGSAVPPRDPSLVFLAGIVGVPWQDVATADSLASPTSLTYLTATDLLAQGRWTQLLGNASTSPPVPPSDPFMIETTQPRSGMNPNTLAAITPATSMSPTANAINGHEQNVPQQDDLQYACTFQLATPKVCAAGDTECDCSATLAGDTSALTVANSPICQPPGGGAPGTTQYYAKAYPGARELTVLRDFGNNAIVASICPKLATSASPAVDPNYGYNPAVSAIVDRLKEQLGQRCLPRAIAHTEDSSGNNTISCQIVEAQKTGSCNCGQPGRSPADPTLVPAVFRQLEESGTCGPGVGQTPCDATGFCMCDINQEQGADLTSCEANVSTPTAGFCYIDDPASAALKNCPTSQKRLIRFVDQGSAKTPADGALTFIACPGAAIASDGGT
jgi:hypothetical protein